MIIIISISIIISRVLSFLGPTFTWLPAVVPPGVEVPSLFRKAMMSSRSPETTHCVWSNPTTVI